MKILNYLAGTRMKTLLFKAKVPLTLELFADAAHMVHKDAKGHGGIIGVLGSAPVFTKSFKFKLVPRSSTESEMVCLEESVTFALWVMVLIRDFVELKLPVTIYQDNLSTIGIVMNGGSFNRSKHMIAKYGFVKQYVDLGKIQLAHCRTQVMVADMLTKPLVVATQKS
jgi:hypothetical protein